jgi:Transposase DDE domain
MYNESLIRRGEILLDFDVIDNWDFELEKMNQGKEGRKFVYPDSFIKLLGYMRAYFHLPYRQTEGIVRELMLQIHCHCHHQFQIIVTFVEE